MNLVIYHSALRPFLELPEPRRFLGAPADHPPFLFGKRGVNVQCERIAYP
jgi:hypothetical protein